MTKTKKLICNKCSEIIKESDRSVYRRGQHRHLLCAWVECEDEIGTLTDAVNDIYKSICKLKHLFSDSKKT